MKDKDLAEILETEVSEETKKEFTGNRGEDDEQ